MEPWFVSAKIHTYVWCSRCKPYHRTLRLTTMRTTAHRFRSSLPEFRDLFRGKLSLNSFKALYLSHPHREMEKLLCGVSAQIIPCVSGPNRYSNRGDPFPRFLSHKRERLACRVAQRATRHLPVPTLFLAQVQDCAKWAKSIPEFAHCGNDYLTILCFTNFVIEAVGAATAY